MPDTYYYRSAGDGSQVKIKLIDNGDTTFSEEDDSGGGTAGASTIGTDTTVASSATVVTLQALNTARLGWTVFNESSAILYVKCGSGASATSYTVQVAAGGYWELPLRYTGILTGLWASANGNARVVEFT